MSFWYEAYYGGKMFLKVKELHQKYGPIVRITPDEVHVDDPSAVEQVYPTLGRKTDKPAWLDARTGVPGSTFSTVHHDQHRQRRSAISPFFSPASVHRLEHILKENLGKMLARLDRHSRAGDIVQIHYVFKALASDLITFYCFDQSMNHLDASEYGRGDMDASDKLFFLTHIGKVLPWVMNVYAHAPGWIIRVLLPDVYEQRKRRDWWSNAVTEIKTSPDPQRIKRTIFEGLLNSKLPESDKTDLRLASEAQLVVFAGEGTTAWTMHAALFHILTHPKVYTRLKTELATLSPTADGIPSLNEVESLPYLAAIVQETVRIHPGVMSRQIRVSPDVPILYKNQTTGKEYSIPPGSVHSMSPYDTHMNAEYFENPYEFVPERWIENPTLSKYFIGFSRGSRNCVGISLARREVAITLATLLLKYDLYSGQDGPTMEVHDTYRTRDLDPHFEFIQPFPARGSRGVQIKFRA
ncbi:cytochrome P450 [Coniella lustricola]|uniref:Cytochrome P450 n=1 Tax=Coniella lustricola TaxID=2025994 RepID=A0A2T3A059_9PEZI|nr:cytochrome P450 [Coniella lustricola]